MKGKSAKFKICFDNYDEDHRTSLFVVSSSSINEVYSKRYSNTLEAAASLVTSCSSGVCISNTDQPIGKNNV